MAQPDDAELPFSLLLYYATSPYPCSYLPDREARSQVATPAHLIDSEIYSSAGARRLPAQRHLHLSSALRPLPGLRAGAPAGRRPATQPQPAPGHEAPRRTCAPANCPWSTSTSTTTLYNRYQQSRHPGGGMDEDSHEQYAQFLLQSRVDTRLIEFRDEQGLRMVSLIDVLDDGLSSV